MSEHEQASENDDDFAGLAEIARRKRPAPVQTPVTLAAIDMLSDPAGWRLGHRISYAVNAASLRGEKIQVAADWRTTDLPLEVRERLAHWTTVSMTTSWEAECERLRTEARGPFAAYESRIESAIPRRYADACPLPASGDAEGAKALLRQRVKNAAAYTAACSAAIGIAEGSVHRVLLLGPSGAGKTTIAAIMLRVIGQWFSERWEQSLDLPRKPEPSSPEEFLYRPDLEKPIRESRMDTIDWRASRPLLGERMRFMGFGAWRRMACYGGFRAAVRGEENPVQWVTARDAFQAAAAPRGFPRSGEEPTDPLRVWKRAPLLVLDDIGGEPEQRNIEAVDGILWHRHDEDDRVVTIATTGFYDERSIPKNMAKADEHEVGEMLKPLAQRYGAALVRRIAEPGQAVVIPVIPKPAVTNGKARDA